MVASLPPTTPDKFCLTHGRVLHALVHEAGHAVIAKLHNITYVTVSVPRTLGPTDPKFGAFVGGGLDMGRMPEAWVPDDPVRALEMLLAGRAAELILLGHDLPDSYRGDATVWGWGMRAHPDVVDGGGQAAAVTALGEPFNAIVQRTADHVEARTDQVIAVAIALHDSSDWALTNAEVVALL